MADRLRAPTPALLFAICGFALAGAAGAIVLRVNSPNGGEDPGLQAGLLVWIVLSYVFCGSVAWARRPENHFGPLMIAAGLLTLVASLASATGALPFTIGQAFDLVPFALFLHVFLAFPSGRLRRTSERILVGAAYVIAVGVQLIGLMLGGFRPDNVVAIVSEPDLAATIFDVQLVALAAILLCGIVALARRRWVDPPPLRRSVALLVDLFAVGLVMCAVLLVTGTFFPGSAFIWIQRSTFLLLGFAPLAFLVALLDARLARSSVGDLLVELGADPGPKDLREPIARALNDSSLQLAYWLPQFETWADPDGAATVLPDGGEGQATTLIERDGERIAALIHDPSLADEPELLEAVSAAAGIALENGRLHAELKANLEELKSSRGRVIEAGQQERKRLERNLHDGAQQRLIALSLELEMLSNNLVGEHEARSRIATAREEIAVSLDELRVVARGLHPAVLTGHGLGVALESLAATSAVPVELDVGLEGRLREQVEVAAYYVVSESLANIGKHAHAENAKVSVAPRAGLLVVEVVDDGVGGADTEAGSGLRGLADRVESLGGRLRVWTPPGGGTRVRADLPCE